MRHQHQLLAMIRLKHNTVIITAKEGIIALLKRSRSEEGQHSKWAKAAFDQYGPLDHATDFSTL